MALQLGTIPFWIDSVSLPVFGALDRDERADVAVVGGGIAGLTTAYLLAREGRSVVVLERDRCAMRDTGHTTAHLAMVTDTPLGELVKTFGRDDAQAAWDAGLTAIMVIQRLVQELGIECGFAWVPGYTHRPRFNQGGRQEATWYRQEAAIAEGLGFDAEYVGDVPLVGGPGIRFGGEARFHPRTYLAGVARAITAIGGRIYEQSAAQEFSTEPRAVVANGHRVLCDRIVLATHTPLAGVESFVAASLTQTKQALYSTYAVAGRVAKGRVPDVLLWDTGDPYDYVRVEPLPDGDLVIYGGEDHKTGQASDTDACFDRLERKLRALVPGVAMAYRWSGQVVETADGLPYIGETADGQFAATGFSGNGMTFGTLAGMMAFDWVEGRANPWRDLFDPHRKKIRGAAWDYARENKDYPYYMARDRLVGGETPSLESIAPGEGAVVAREGEALAVFRDQAGRLSAVSAVCTHMGCHVAFNRAEQTWDCPCHGSRFATDGRVIGGPAERPLPPRPV